MLSRFRPKSRPLVEALAPQLQPFEDTAIAASLAAVGFRLVAALGVAHLATCLIVGGGFPIWAGIVGALAIAGAVTSGLIAVRATVRAEAAVADGVLRLFTRFMGRSGIDRVADVSAGELITRIDRHPALCANALLAVPQTKMLAAVGPLLTVVVIAFFHWPSALFILMAMPLMVVGLITTGKITKKRAAVQEEALHRLAGGFAERVRCLPTILSSHAEVREEGRLAADLAAYRDKTMAVLRVAFLNTAVLDVVTALAIAGLAVSLGLGALGLATIPGFAGASLGTTLAVLALVPEAFAPLRRFAEIYHKAAESRAALDLVTPLIDERPMQDGRLPAERFGLRGVVSAVNGAYPDLDLPRQGLVVVEGPSGCGKTTLLRLLAGIDAPLRGQVFKPAGVQAWAATNTHFKGHRVGDAIPADTSRWLEAVGLAREPRFAAAADTRLGPGAQALSGGQRLRLSLAAAASSAAETVFADEPTAKLDDASAECVRKLLSEMSRDRLVIVASHDPRLMARADVRVDLGDRVRIAS